MTRRVSFPFQRAVRMKDSIFLSASLAVYPCRSISSSGGGYDFISSAGDANKIKSSQQKIVNSLIGIIIVIAAIFLLSLVGELLHVEFLDIGETIKSLAP